MGQLPISTRMRQLATLSHSHELECPVDFCYWSWSSKNSQISEFYPRNSWTWNTHPSSRNRWRKLFLFNQTLNTMALNIETPNVHLVRRFGARHRDYPQILLQDNFVSYRWKSYHKIRVKHLSQEEDWLLLLLQKCYRKVWKCLISMWNLHEPFKWNLFGGC